MEEVTCIVCSGGDSKLYTTLYDRLKLSSKKFSIFKCKCGLLYLNPRPDSKEILEYYQSGNYDPHSAVIYNFRILLYSYIQKILFRWKLGVINKYYKKGKLIDIGGGIGLFVQYMSSKGWNAILQEKYLLPNKGIDSIVDIESLYDIQHKGKYNVITLWHSLEHIHNINDYFKAFDRILANNGIVLIAVPNISAPEKNFYKESWAPYDAPRHLYHFNITTLNQLCHRYGYTIIRKYSFYQDLPYNVLLSMKHYSFLEVIKAIFVTFLSLMATSILGPNYSSSFLVICKKSN